MQLMNNDVPEFLAVADRALDNARIIDYKAPDDTKLARATQVTHGVLEKLSELVGMDNDQDYSFLLADNEDKPLMQIITKVFSPDPKVTVEYPVGNVSGIFHFVKTGMIYLNTSTQRIARVIRPVGGEQNLPADQKDLFLLLDRDDKQIGRVASPYQGFQRKQPNTEQSMVDALWQVHYDFYHYSRPRSELSLDQTHYKHYAVKVEQELTIDLRVFAIATLIAIRYGYHQSIVGFRDSLPAI